MKGFTRQISRVLSFTLLLFLFDCAGVSAQWRSGETYGRDFLTIGEYNQIDAITASPFRAYFASLDGILRYDIINGIWLEPLDYSLGFYGPPVRRMAVSIDDEKLWSETNMGIFLYERIFAAWEERFDFPTHEIRGSYVAPEHLHVTEPGLHYLPGGKLLDDFGRQFATHPNYLDESGYLWIGVQGLGPARSEPDGGQLQILPFGLLDREISELGSYGGQLLIGSPALDGLRSGVTFLDTEEGEFSYLEQGVDHMFPRVAITAFADNDESWLVGTELGLYEVNKDTHRVAEHFNRFNGLPHAVVTSVAVVGETVLVGTRSGIGMIRADSSGVKEVARNALAFQEIYSVVPDLVASRGRLPVSSNPTARYVWIGAEEGVYRLDLKNFSLKKLTDPEFILDSPTRQLRMSGASLWALADDGLVRVDLRKGDVESFPEFNRNNWQSTIAVNSEFIAIGASDGFTLMSYRYLEDSDSSHAVVVSHKFGLGDGLPSNNVTALEFIDEYLWVGTDRGLCRFWWANPARDYTH